MTMGPRLKARIAGVFYLITFVAGVFALMSANGRFAANLIATACYVAVTLLFYDLFKPVNRSLSLLAALVSLVGLVMGLLTMFHVAPFHINNLVFFGFYCLLIGYLILKSTFLPRILGVFMAIGGLGWLTFLSSSLEKFLSPYNMAPGIIGEGILTIWLLAVGLNEQRWKEQASAPKLMRHLTAALLILFAIPAFAANDAELITAGRAALSHGELDRAIAQFEKAVTVNPNNSEGHYYLGMAYGRQAQKAGIFRGMSEIGKAKAEWLRAVELNPNYVDARLALIDFYIVAPAIVGGSEDKAIEQAVEVRKRDALDGHRAYARIYTRQKKFDLAVKEMVEAVREQPKSAKAHHLLGNALLNQEDWKGSLHEYEMALSLDAAYMPAYFRIGQNAARSESNYARGEEAIRKYLEYKPADDEPPLANAWYWLGMIQEKQGKKAEARQSYLNGQKLAPDSKDIGEALKRVS